MALTPVLVLSDGVAGHDRASAGVLAALSQHRRIDPVWLPVREVRPASRRLARLAAAATDPARWLDRGVVCAARWPPHAEIVVSAGPATAAVNIAAARRYGARNVYCGFAKWPVVGFHVLLTPVPSRARAAVLAPRPTDLDATRLPGPRPLGAPGQRTVALLLGGDSKHYAYTRGDMDALAASLAALLASRPDWSLIAFDSRRTAPHLFDVLARALGHCERLDTVRYARAGLGSNAPAFEADLAVVTEDSLSMITEAVAAARPTLVARADGYRGPRRDRREVDALAAAGRVARTTFSALTVETLERVLRPPHTSQPAALSALLQARGL
ncbi:ELM1/GtrOC1 family putative glycosyltransferase [Acuticoccus sp.]|uniref:ELM1/GtrOC1 family putative glycosyltransferase n=1 Tax=Acuticoccus sp. TaxID=1904378 RepID=UPI003B52B331